MRRAEAFPPHGGRRIDREHVLAAASALFDPGDHHELRGLPSGRSRLVTLGDPVGLADAAAVLSDDHGVYYTLNPVRPDLGNRAAKVGDVLRRRWLLIDVDRRKLVDPDDSATQEEKDATWAVAAKVQQRLRSEGWPEPVLIDSGNGFHLLYRVDLPNDDDARKLLAAVLKRLAKEHDSEAADVDVKVHNVSRVSKLPGTWACKGTETAERPHRMARLLDVPGRVEVVTREQLEALAAIPEAAPGPAAVVKPSRPGRPKDRRTAYLEKALTEEVGRVAMAREGERNDTLNDAAFRLGTLLGAGLDRGEVEQQLATAAQRAGLDPEEIEATIRSGLDGGAAKPRDVPEQRAKGRVIHPGATGESGGEGTLEDKEVITICLNDVAEEDVRWLWPGRIPLGMLTLIAGDQKVGKGFLMMDLAARVTTGGEIPGLPGECMPEGSVVILTAEEGLATTIKPRLVAAGGDPRKVHEFSGIRTADGQDASFDLTYLAHIEHAVRRFGDTKLLIVDPVTSYLPPGIDDHKAVQLRVVFRPLVTMAERLGLAVVFIHHLTKGTSTKGLYRVSGSGAYTQVCRSNWLVCKDPHDKGRRLFLSLGTNLVEEPTGLAYRIDRETRAVAWEDGSVMMTADEALKDERDEAASERRENASKIEQCEAWLDEVFRPGRTVKSDDILKEAAAKGFNRTLAFSAKKRLPWLRARKDGFAGDWLWYSDPQVSAQESDDSKGPHGSDTSDTSDETGGPAF